MSQAVRRRLRPFIQRLYSDVSLISFKELVYAAYVPSVIFSVIVPHCVKRFVRIGILERPTLWHECLEEDIGLLGVEARSRYDLAQTCHTEVTL